MDSPLLSEIKTALDEHAEQTDHRQWRKTQDGWSGVLAEGISGNIQLTKRGGVRWNLMLTGTCDTIAQARETIEDLFRCVTEEEQ